MPYEIVDVFTDRPFAGNPLAVVFDAELLGTAQMAALAREFNLSETVFVLPPSAAAPEATYRARIFTPASELPFAGHPSVGAAVTVTRRGLAAPGTLRQECGAGVLPIEVTAHGEARLTGGTPTLGADRDPAPLLEIAGLSAADLAGPAPRPAGCGLEHLYLAVRPDAVSRATLDAAAAARHGVPKQTVFAWNAATHTAHLRMFAPGVGVAEDPATGSAALGLGVWLTGAGLLPADGTTAYTIHQGAEIHRPSTLDCTVTAAAGTAVSATVAGHVVEIANGKIAVPPFVG
ncbi:PhzF family phenazine biosynthesis protein [Catenuloplanes indicus JCM 9534]